MLDTKNIPWRKIITEGVVIVISILMAFAIDAWWNNRIERAQEREHLVSMRDEFQKSIVGLNEIQESVELHAKDINTIIAQLKSVPPGESIVLSAEIIGSINMWRTTDVSTSTLTALMSSGSLNMLSNPKLRAELAGLPALLLDMTEDEIISQQFAENVMSSHLVELGIAEIIYAHRGNSINIKGILPTAPTEIRVEHNQKLIDLLSIRRVHLWYSEITIPPVRDYLENLIRLINEELEQ